MTTGQSNAVNPVEVYRIRPAQGGSLGQYGMHFDTAAGTYHMARDWSIGGGGSASLRVYLQDAMASGTQFQLTQSGSCGVLAQAGYFSGGSWHGYTGEWSYFTHLTSRVANGTVTTAMTSVGSMYTDFVGNSSTCGTVGAHVHQSADVGASTPYYRYLPLGGADTCWSDVTDSAQCPSAYPLDGGGACPPSSTSGTGSVSGSITRYTCQTWSLQTWPSENPLVVAKW
jgi:hypothetical protein